MDDGRADADLGGDLGVGHSVGFRVEDLLAVLRHLSSVEESLQDREVPLRVDGVGVLPAERRAQIGVGIVAEVGRRRGHS